MTIMYIFKQTYMLFQMMESAYLYMDAWLKNYGMAEVSLESAFVALTNSK